MKSDALEVFLDALSGTDPGRAIENQEARGQRQFVSQQTLPVECPRKELEEIGFQFGDPVDELFVRASFPEGWTKRATEHSMWSNLLDPKNRVRGRIFYKAAFYDKRSFMHLSHRYGIQRIYLNKEKAQCNVGAEPSFTCCVVMDGDTEIYRTECVGYRDWVADDKIEKEAADWLGSKYPEYKDATAYWD